MIYTVSIAIYLFALVGVGIYKTKMVKNSEDFMVAGRVLPWYILVGTLLATWMGSGSLFSGAGLGYRNGPAALWSSAGAWLGITLIYFIAKRIRNFGKITVPDIFEIRYGRFAALLATIITVIAYTTIVSYQFRGGGKVLEMVSNGMISLEIGIIITAVFAISYTVLAGMFSVVYTDVVNGVLITIGVLAALMFMLINIGGIEEMIQIADQAGKWSLFGNWSAERTGDISGPIIALSFFVPTMLLLMGDANMYQRIFSAKDGGSAKKAVFFWVVGVVILESSISFLGLTGSVAAEQGIMPDIVQNEQGIVVRNAEILGLSPSEDELLSARQSGSESVIPAIAIHGGLPLIIGLILVSTMMAIIVSTADSFLLIPATNLTRDVYQKYINKNATEKKVIFISRMLVLFLGLIAFLLVSQFKTVLNAAFTAYNIYGASLTPALLAAFLWKRATKEGAAISILTGSSITIIWTYLLPNWSGFKNLHPFLQELTYPAAGLSVFALIFVSLFTDPPPKKVLSQFFNDDDL
ncbi:sodium:solute symporter family protein [Candidatus Marinimicrobia bacterium]|nr:sodium:solute symporter family protein [Candidatus Neomarinimicrobiota bacterium]